MPLPQCDAEQVRRRLREECRIEGAVNEWSGAPLLRVSIYAYNEPGGVAALIDPLPAVI